MSIKTTTKLQFKVFPNAPEEVHKVAPLAVRIFLIQSAPFLLAANDGIAPVFDQMFTSDSDIKISLLETRAVDKVELMAYLFEHNKYRTFIITNKMTSVTTYELNSSLVNKLRETAESMNQKYDSIYSLHDEPMAPPSVLQKHSLMRPVMLFDYVDTFDPKNDAHEIASKLQGALGAHLLHDGYMKIKETFKTSYLPNDDDHNVHIKHANLFEHKTANLVFFANGIEINDQYYYTGDWYRCDLDKDNNPEHEVANKWGREIIERQVDFLNREGMNAIPIFL